MGNNETNKILENIKERDYIMRIEFQDGLIRLKIQTPIENKHNVWVIILDNNNEIDRYLLPLRDNDYKKLNSKIYALFDGLYKVMGIECINNGNETIIKVDNGKIDIIT